MKTVLVIGGGISGLVSAINLKNKGYKVILVEKNRDLGGRLYQQKFGDYIINNGPSWYWMPSVINSVYHNLGIKDKDIYNLVKLDPQFKIIFDKEEFDIPGEYEDIKSIFKNLDTKSDKNLDTFMENSKYKYQKGFSKFIFYPNLLINEYLEPKLLYYIYKFNIFQSYRSLCRKISNNSYIQKLVEWPALFIGSNPKNITGLYSLLSYSMFKEGTYIPSKKGMIEIIDLLTKYCYKNKITIIKETEVVDFIFTDNKITKVKIKTNENINNLIDVKVDYVMNSADYFHIEHLLPNKFRSYPLSYWDKFVVCPSCLLFSITLNTTLDKLQFHNLFFKGSLDNHTNHIYNYGTLPKEPLFYLNITTKLFTEAPEGEENLFILIPSNPDIVLSSCEIKRVYKYVIKEISLASKVDIENHIISKRIFKDKSFGNKFNSFKFNAYGLGCDKFQNIFIRPKLKSLYVENLYFCGQTTSPGPGIAPCMISGLNSSNLLYKDDIEENKSYIPQKYDTIIYYLSKYKYIFFRLVTHFITLICIIGFNRDLYFGMKREYNYLVNKKFTKSNSF